MHDLCIIVKDHIYSSRIGTEDFEELAHALQLIKGAGDLRVFLMAFAIDKEIIVPGFAFGGPGFDLGQIDAVFLERC